MAVAMTLGLTVCVTFSRFQVVANAQSQASLDGFSSIEKELNQKLAEQTAAWNRGDLKSFMEPYWQDERLTFSSGGKVTRGWETTYQRYKSRYPDKATMGKLTFSHLESQPLGENAVLMLGNWELERDQPVGGNFSLVWKKIANQWRIIHDHSSARE
jgi:beta-aspartyl-peptidase (threonine type)